MKHQAAFFLVVLLVAAVCSADEKAKSGKEEKKAKKTKSILNYNERDLDELARQWEDEEERDDEDNWPPKPKQAGFDPSKMTGDPNDVENMLRQSKKGQSLMVFVRVADSPTKAESEKITSLWEEMLRNGGILIQRYLISDDRAIFMLQDGSQAWEMKDFLIEQEGVAEVEIEQKKTPGKKPYRKKKDEL